MTAKSPNHSPLTAPPFGATRYELAPLDTRQTAADLSPVQPDEAAALAEMMCAIPPWSTYAVKPAHLESLFRVTAGGAYALALRVPTMPQPVGVVVIRSPWLIGPYVQFLGLDPCVHGHGLGTRVLYWLEAEAKLANARNLWICVAGFNTGAYRLYKRFGFERVATLDDLIKDGIPEILMRKRLT
jgi:diamine N-acetyltransferase